MYPMDSTTLRTLRSVDLTQAGDAWEHHQVPEHQIRRAWQRRGRRLEVLDRSLPLFRGLSRRDARRLVQLLDTTSVFAGRSLGEQGDTVDAVSLVLDGRVGVSIDGCPVAVLERGSHFDALPMLDPDLTRVRPATFTALTRATIGRADAESFGTILDQFPSIRHRVRSAAEISRSYLTGRADGASDSVGVTEAVTTG